jgi:hypothetical protein
LLDEVTKSYRAMTNGKYRLHLSPNNHNSPHLSGSYTLVMIGMKRRWCGICGAPDGVIVTVKLPMAVLPDGSLAVQVTVVAPSGKVLPLAGVHVTGTAPATVSLAVAV